ncbi:MAG: hypothetical protein GX119_03650 [Syntrophomonadaceae bacterium]|nr:hypothetical protein [Syntrophomonadaceae bacterium]
MINTFALHPAASKNLIARAVCQLPEVKWAWGNGKIFIGHGSTNVAVAQELLNLKIEHPEQYISGVISQRVACATEPRGRSKPWCIDKGRVLDVDWIDFVNTFKAGDIFIKGANAIDPAGNAGILLGDLQGGTIGKSIGILKARGVQIIVPVGLEKMILSCPVAEKVMGIEKSARLLGMKTGYISVSNATIISEIESLKILLDLDAIQIAAGGVGGMEGAVVLAVNYKDEATEQELIKLIKGLSRKPRLNIKRKSCRDCEAPCAMLDN